MTTHKFGCYIYYDADWNPYYVGKGSRRRARNKQLHTVIVPEPSQVQWFFFDEEWKAYECEIELISFFGRINDGGVLLNVSAGGPGKRMPCPQATKDKMSATHKGKVISAEQRKKTSAKLKGRKISPEVRARMAEGQRKRRLREANNA